MKLLYCKWCGDVFQLRLGKLRSCDCGKVKGQYINNSLAEVNEDAISLAIGNGALISAIGNMITTQKNSGDKADRQDYIKAGNLIFAWCRPNEGPGNPHTKVVKKFTELENAE